MPYSDMSQRSGLNPMLPIAVLHSVTNFLNRLQLRERDSLVQHELANQLPVSFVRSPFLSTLVEYIFRLALPHVFKYAIFTALRFVHQYFQWLLRALNNVA